MGILEGSGEITDIVNDIVKICSRVGEEDIIIYEKEPKKLIGRLAELNQ